MVRSYNHILKSPTSARVKVLTLDAPSHDGSRQWSDGKLEAPRWPNIPWLLKCPETGELCWLDTCEPLAIEADEYPLPDFYELWCKENPDKVRAFMNPPENCDPLQASMYRAQREFHLARHRIAPDHLPQEQFKNVPFAVEPNSDDLRQALQLNRFGYSNHEHPLRQTLREIHLRETLWQHLNDPIRHCLDEVDAHPVDAENLTALLAAHLRMLPPARRRNRAWLQEYYDVSILRIAEIYRQLGDFETSQLWLSGLHPEMWHDSALLMQRANRAQHSGLLELQPDPDASFEMHGEQPWHTNDALPESETECPEHPALVGWHPLDLKRIVQTHSPSRPRLLDGFVKLPGA